ncbi:MAG: hypothetical protein H6817_07365 [Phycisphaerales bacterium]|nr:hypothetical protein [Phycisphaerales bacterium]
MRVAPRLEDNASYGAVEERFALLLNPFYPKDPHSSFGKHVLTPTLALTAVAGATPPSWRVDYWDENYCSFDRQSINAAGCRHHRSPTFAKR